ncbi:MAG: threonine aldolase family protein [Aureispira sp.]
MIIDLRSDTVTQPTLAMKAAMMNAPLGDDVWGDDPTVLELEAMAATLFGKEAAVFCPSGTMTNQIAINILTSAPGEVICDHYAHVYQYEGGGIGFNSRMATQVLEGDKGRLTAAQIEKAIRSDDIHFAPTQLVCLENTCNKAGGTIYELDEIKKISALCKRKGLKLHLDGARIFNALVEADYTAQELGQCFDTLSICLSKGLGAPVGSLLLGAAKDMKRARRIRKIWGGGMRQSGILAAAGIFALNNNVERLVEDHQRAKDLAQCLTTNSYIEKVLPVYTNIIIARFKKEYKVEEVIEKWGEQGLRVAAFGPQQVRLTLHLEINDPQVEAAKEIIEATVLEQKEA